MNFPWFFSHTKPISPCPRPMHFPWVLPEFPQNKTFYSGPHPNTQMANAQATREARTPNLKLKAGAPPKPLIEPLMRQRSAGKRRVRGETPQEAVVVPLRAQEEIEAELLGGEEPEDEGRMKCQLLGITLQKEPLRSNEEAWEIAIGYERAVRYMLRKHGMFPKNEQDEEAFLALGMDAAFLAALTWDESKGKFMTHLNLQIMRCFRALFELRESAVLFPAHRTTRANKYRKWRSKNPQGTINAFAAEAEISTKDAQKSATDLKLLNGVLNPVDAHDVFNGGFQDEGSDMSNRRERNASSRDCSSIAEHPNNCDFHEAAIESMDFRKVSARILEILQEVVANPRDLEIMNLRIWEGMTLDEIGNIFELSRERVRQIEKKILLKLGSSKHRDELREYLSSFY